jgi:hypothetical protein
MDNFNQLIDDIKNTLEINRQVLVDLMSKNYTREISISFNVNPEEIVTMDVFTQKMVISKENYISANINKEVQNDTSK